MTIRTMLWSACLSVAVIGCGREGERAADVERAPIRPVSVETTATLVAAGQCQVLDANGDTTRKRMGIIPGATLLSSYETYALSELPGDKSRPLIFYCANEQCGASHVAAERALTAGYSDVRVLPVGIAGWTQAGKPVQQL